MTNDMTEIAQFAGQVSQQNDRYLFVVVMVILLTFAWIVLKHLTKQNAALVAKLESEQVASRQTNERLILCIDHNTKALTDNARALTDCTSELSKCRDNCTKRSYA